jgi:predicted MPP superfamily phosphohydrolase
MAIKALRGTRDRRWLACSARATVKPLKHLAVSRRHAITGGAALLAGSAFDALVIEPHWLDITTHDVPVPGLPRGLDGFTIAQVTDAHLQRIGPVEEAIARELRAHDVQLLVLTGDIVDSRDNLSVLRDFSNAVRRSGMAAVATLGNWEHWGGISDD